jgi:hypothetical protein
LLFFGDPLISWIKDTSFSGAELSFVTLMSWQQVVPYLALCG